MQKLAVGIVSVLLLATCSQPEEEVRESPSKTMIAFGSCATQDSTNLFWAEIAAKNPNVFIWLGDNIYGDSEDPAVLAEKYRRQKAQPAYRAFLEVGIPVIGTWDDHDYGANDAGKEFRTKKESKELLLDFLDVPKDASVRNREGVYQSYTYGEQGRQVKVILLDTRWFRDSLAVDTTGKGKYMPIEKGTMLGQTQWKWLEYEVLNADVEVLLIGSSIQAISDEHGWEAWGTMPNERKRLLTLLSQTNAGTTVILSGDRHHAEVSRIKLKNDKWLYDVTASGLTHVFTRQEEEPNANRVGPLVVRRNYALLEIDWFDDSTAISTQLKGLGDTTYFEHVLKKE